MKASCQSVDLDDMDLDVTHHLDTQLHLLCDQDYAVCSWWFKGNKYETLKKNGKLANYPLVSDRMEASAAILSPQAGR